MLPVHRFLSGVFFLLLAACPRPSTPADASKSIPGPPDGGTHHTERLARTSWKSDTARACGTRGACVAASPSGALANDPGEAGFAVDGSPVDAMPGAGGRCRVVDDDVLASSKGPPARATLWGPSGATPLAAWQPPVTVDGDYFALETSFSPDGKWLAIARLAVHLGDEAPVVDVAGLEVRAAPACR